MLGETHTHTLPVRLILSYARAHRMIVSPPALLLIAYPLPCPFSSLLLHIPQSSRIRARVSPQQTASSTACSSLSCPTNEVLQRTRTTSILHSRRACSRRSPICAPAAFQLESPCGNPFVAAIRRCLSSPRPSLSRHRPRPCRSSSGLWGLAWSNPALSAHAIRPYVRVRSPERVARCRQAEASRIRRPVRRGHSFFPPAHVSRLESHPSTDTAARQSSRPLTASPSLGLSVPFFFLQQSRSHLGFSTLRRLPKPDAVLHPADACLAHLVSAASSQASHAHEPFVIDSLSVAQSTSAPFFDSSLFVLAHDTCRLCY